MFCYSIQFPITRLTDYGTHPEALKSDRNLLTYVVLAHSAAQTTRQDAPAHATMKFQLIRRLYERGWTRPVVEDLYQFIDWLLRLPEEVGTAGAAVSQRRLF
jgi:hypothetical protein